MAIKQKIFSSLAVLALAGGIAATVVHTTTASAGGPVVTHNGSASADVWPFDAD